MNCLMERQHPAPASRINGCLARSIPTSLSAIGSGVPMAFKRSKLERLFDIEVCWGEWR